MWVAGDDKRKEESKRAQHHKRRKEERKEKDRWDVVICADGLFKFRSLPALPFQPNFRQSRLLMKGNFTWRKPPLQCQ